jgi:hypothetical protein
MFSLLTLFACGTADPPPDPPVAEAATSPAPPVGAIGGEPILPRPVVLGGISAEAVDAAIDTRRDAIEACFQEGLAENPGLAGKVLVRFTIVRDGSVSKATIRSTSLRHAATEACLSAQVAEAQFPTLEVGEAAIVTYPFGFP